MELFGTSMSTYHILELRRFQGFVCSPNKVVRELGLERRETVWSLSTVDNGKMRGSQSSTRGPNRVDSGVSVVLLKAVPSSYVN